MAFQPAAEFQFEWIEDYTLLGGNLVTLQMA
jgi:hypothetical protein